MPKYYFTYGTDPAYPFQGGWTEVTAPDELQARRLFQMFHSVPEGIFGVLNCAEIYSEDKFIATDMFRNGCFGAWCQEEITVSRNLIAGEGAKHED